VTWGGDPFKAVIIGNDPSELSPRRSFAQWHQLVEGTSDPWTPSDLTAARLIGDTVADVVLQFRSVRMLIAQDQLENVSRQVRMSDQPVIVADANGRILLTNEAFERLLRATHPHLQFLDDLPQLFTEPVEVRNSLRALLRERRPWRGEVRLETNARDPKPLTVRADPVFSSPDRVLGHVLLFTDLSERKTAEDARRRFQERILEGKRMSPALLDSRNDFVYQNLLTLVVENAQLAALEITYGVDTVRMPGMLESVRASVTRTTELLERLISHASLSLDSEQ
jgi:PAS domain-containing protein